MSGLVGHCEGLGFYRERRGAVECVQNCFIMKKIKHIQK